jgi:UPF0042 nucleotide-binding protein
MITETPSDAPAKADQAEPVGQGEGRTGGGESDRLVVITGMSGAGKTLALKSLEDLGYEAVDNLPLSLLGAVLQEGGRARPLALGIDIRTRDFAARMMAQELDRLMARRRLETRLLFVDCDDEELRRRFTETRRRHPLALDRPLADGIRHERELVSPLRERADLVIDTTSLPPAELKRVLAGHFRLDAKPALGVFVTSFSYRQGLPRDADLVFDTRFLSNPHYVIELRPLTGRDPRVAAHVEADPGFAQFFAAVTELIEGKSYLTIAFGCTGGRHRSVVVAEKLGRWLRQHGMRVDLRHRELDEGDIK